MNYVVIDLEFNQPFDFPRGKKTEVVPSCPLEIIQIGAVKLNSNLEIIETKDFLVKPFIYKRIHPYVKKITGISLEMLRKQPYFQSAYEEFLSFLGNEEYVFCVWGSTDIKTLFDNVKLYNLDYSNLSTNYIDVQQLTSLKLELAQGLAVGLKSAVEKFELEMLEPFHYALNDAVYTAKIFQIVNKKDVLIKSYSPVQVPKTKTYSFDAEGLYKVVEKDYGRKLSKKERQMAQKIYLMGRSKQFDLSKKL